MPESFKASAPGKLMLLGEHAVLHGKRCLVCAVSQRMHVHVTPRHDGLVTIASDLGEYSSALADLTPNAKFKFVLAAIQQQADEMSRGIDIRITSDFSDNVGLGSSAAVTAALTAALFAMLGKPFSREEIFRQSLKVIRSIQGVGSGADLAASVYGGILAYRMQPLEIRPLEGSYPITVIYSGHKTPTVEVIKRVEEQRAKFPALFAGIYDLMDQSAVMAAEAIEGNDWKTVGELFNINQGLMDAIGVNDKSLADINHALRAEPDILGGKISGSGLGDCFIALGKVTNPDFPFPIIPLQISSQGVSID